VGPGELVFNVDAFRVRTGHFFAPLCWHREKLRMHTYLGTIRSWLATGRDQTVFWSAWLPLQVAQRELLAAGFQPDRQEPAAPGSGRRETWRRPGQVVHLGFLGYDGSPFQPAGPAPASTTGTDTYTIGGNNWEPLTELADDRRWSLLAATPEGFVALYQRR
jgi:hypothetical protein